MSDMTHRIASFALLALAYFVSFPEDAEAISTPVKTFLSLTTVISPALYGVVAVGIVAIAVVKTWGERAGKSQG